MTVSKYGIKLCIYVVRKRLFDQEQDQRHTQAKNWKSLGGLRYLNTSVDVRTFDGVWTRLVATCKIWTLIDISGV